jgi:hypothetical protein
MLYLYFITLCCFPYHFVCSSAHGTRGSPALLCTLPIKVDPWTDPVRYALASYAPRAGIPLIRCGADANCSR